MNRIGRIEALLDDLGVDALLLSSPASVLWATGVPDDLETGQSPFWIQPMALFAPGSEPVLILAEDLDPGESLTGFEVETFPGFGLVPPDPFGGAGEVLGRLIGSRRVAIEPDHLPVSLASVLNWKDAGPALAAGRAIKDPDEIEAVKAAIAVCDAGQRAFRESLESGMSELELWGQIRAAMELKAGSRIPVIADLVSGPRSGQIGGPPTSRVIQEGDPVLCDLVPRVDGYWGDSCSTVCAGQPGRELVRAHSLVHERLDQLVAQIGPGVSIEQIDAAGRVDLGYPHHTGHGIGALWHESPRVVPEAAGTFEQGMVVALEPGYYDDEFGVRLELVLLVTSDGSSVLSGHELRLDG